MGKRHEFREGDWESIALRLDEIISAHSGEDPFDEALKLLVARLAHESSPASTEPFLSHAEGAVRQANRLLRQAVERWPGVLDTRTVTRLSGAELARCAAILPPARLLSEDLVGLDAIFEFIVNRTSKGQKGQYFTPRHVISEVVEMLRPRPGELVADLACGSGGFLRHALLHEPRCSVWGFDQDLRACRVARVMLAASGQEASRIVCTDSLRLPTHRADRSSTVEEIMHSKIEDFQGFDLILTNPPFAGDVGDQFAEHYQLARGRRVERDVLFLERCVELLKPGGRLAIVLPHSKVGNRQWTGVRRWLLERVRLIASLGLGRNTFRPHTGQKACVLVGRKRAAVAQRFDEEEVLFFVSDRDGKDVRGRLLLGADGQRVDHDLPEATPLVRARFDLLAAGV